MESLANLDLGRKLRQTTNSTSQAQSVECTITTCFLFHLLIIATVAGILLFVLGIVWYNKWTLFRAIQKGNVPAEYFVPNWTANPAERGDIAAFKFPLHRPNKRSDINEECCPICLKTRPSPKSWIVFGGCNHATCFKCFKKLANRQRLHAACPICRTLLAVGDGDRGGTKPIPSNEAQSVEEQAAATQPTPTTAAAEQV